MENKISVVLCVYNGENFLHEQLCSIENQTRLPQEVVIVDDGSTDGTLAIVKDFIQRKTLNIQLYTNSKNIGFVKNFEKGIQLAKNNIVILCDQDDVWYKQKIQEIDTFFYNNKVDLVFHNLKLINDRGKFLGYNLWETLAFDYFIKNNYTNQQSILKRVLLFGNVVPGCAMAFKKDKLRITLTNDFPVAMAHDYQILLYFLLNHKVQFADMILGDYRIHDHQSIGLALTNVKQTKDTIVSFYNHYHLPSNVYRIWILKQKYTHELKQSILHKKITILLRNWKEEYKNQYIDQRGGAALFKKIKLMLLYLKFRLYTVYLRIKKK